MSQLNVNIIAPLGYTGPALTGDNNFVQVVDTRGDTVLKVFRTDNTAIGKDALNSNTTGTKNIALGTSALQANTTASNNIAIGHQAMQNSTGNKIQSVAVGTQALQAGASGSVAIGDTAAASSTVAIVAIGNKALQSSTGTSNTAVGNSAGINVTTGIDSTLIGAGALIASLLILLFSLIVYLLFG